MNRFSYVVYEVDSSSATVEDHLKQHQYDTANRAVRDCLDPSKQFDYLQVELLHRNAVFATIRPKQHWPTLLAFEEQLKTHILAMKIQLNIDVDENHAVEQLIIKVVDNERLKIGDKSVS